MGHALAGRTPARAIAVQAVGQFVRAGLVGGLTELYPLSVGYIKTFGMFGGQSILWRVYKDWQSYCRY